jgi:hypothetical protein
MDLVCDGSEKMSEFFIVSLSMEGYISVALVSRDDNREHRDDPMIVFIVTAICEDLFGSSDADRLSESVSFDGHMMEEIDQRR